MTVEEIRQDLKIGRKLVFEMLESGEIPNIQLGRTRIVTREAYQRWKETCGMSPVRRLTRAS